MINPSNTILKDHNVTVVGTVGPPLILIPGFGTDQAAWRYVVEAFRDQYRIVLLDLAGVGPNTQDHYDHARYATLDGYADALLEVLRALRIDGCLCVGHSVAGIVGALASIKAPELFRKLVLLGSSACYRNVPGYHGGFDDADLDALIDSATADYIQWTERFGQLVVSAPPNNPTVREFVGNLRAMRPDMALSILLTVLYSDVRDWLATVTVPAVVLQTRHDAAVTREAAEYLRDCLKDSVLEMLEASGHLPHLTAPDTVIQALRRLL